MKTPSKDTYLEIFNKDRATLRDFLEGIKPDAVSKRLDDALSKGRDVAGTLLTPGLITDAKQFMDAMAKQASDMKDRYQGAFDSFYRQLTGRYTDSLSDDAERKLIEQQFFDQFWGQLKDLDLPGNFKTVADGVTRCESFTADGLEGDEQSQVRGLLQQALEPLKQDLLQYDWSFMDRMKTVWVDTSLSSLRDTLNKINPWRK